MIYRIISALLDYPDATLRAALPEIVTAISSAADVSTAERRVLNEFVARKVASG